MEQFEFEAARPAKPPDVLTRRTVQRLEGRKCKPKELGLRVLLGSDQDEEFGRVRGQCQALEVRPNPSMVREHTGLLETRLAGPSRELKSGVDEEVKAAKPLAALSSARNTQLDAATLFGEDRNDSIGLTDVDLPQQQAAQRLSHATEIAK